MYANKRPPALSTLPLLISDGRSFFPIGLRSLCKEDIVHLKNWRNYKRHISLKNIKSTFSLEGKYLCEKQQKPRGTR